MLNTTSQRSDLLARLHSARAHTDELFGIVKPEFLFERPIAERHRLAFENQCAGDSAANGHSPLLAAGSIQLALMLEAEDSAQPFPKL